MIFSLIIEVVLTKRYIMTSMLRTDTITDRGAKQGGGGLGESQHPLNFGEGVQPPLILREKKFNCSHIGPFLIV